SGESHCLPECVAERIPICVARRSRLAMGGARGVAGHVRRLEGGHRTVTPIIGKPTEDQQALLRGRQALRLVSADLPHLAGLAHLVRMKVTKKVPVAAVADSGLVLLNPAVFSSVPLADAAFV